MFTYQERAKGLWPRIVKALQTHGDADGWVSRRDLLRVIGNVGVRDVVGELNAHADELEQRFVGPRKREEVRIKP